MELEIKAKQQDKKKKYDDWEVEGFARTLMEAEEIKADPEKLKLAKAVVEKKHAAVMGLKVTLDDMKKKGADMPMEEEYEGREDEKKEK